MSFIRHAPLIAAALAAAGMLVSAGPIAAAVVTLMWTAPGDDAMIGIASLYDLRYSRDPLTPENFASGTEPQDLPLPLPAGQLQVVTVRDLVEGEVYYFALKTADERGNWSVMSNVVSVVIPGPSVGFSAPWPNPARGIASFSVTLPQAGHVAVRAFDLAGRQVRVLASGPRGAGSQDLVWDLCDDQGRALPPGVYLVEAVFGDRRFLRRVILAP